MNCAYHAETQNVAFCIRCGRALCGECVRNVRGSIYCENCLGELVAGKPSGSSMHHDVVAGTNPGAAFVLGLIPGVGAIYNGEFVKAAVHVLIFGILISLSATGLPLFGLLIAAFYFYMPFEAYYTAKKRKLRTEGIELETPIDRLHQQLGGIEEKELWGGIALIVIGGLFLLGNLNIFNVARMGRLLWPLFLIGLGLWRLKYHKSRRV